MLMTIVKIMDGDNLKIDLWNMVKIVQTLYGDDVKMNGIESCYDDDDDDDGVCRIRAQPDHRR